MVKRGRTARAGSVQFSAEPGNVLSVNTYKYSGLANEKTVDVTSDLKLITKVCGTRNSIVKSCSWNIFSF